MNSSTSDIVFYGGTGDVTGANFLFEDKTSGLRVLTDCGFFQGSRVGDEKNRQAFPYDPKTIDILFVTHAHIDHIGRIPRLVKEGFRGVIYSTPSTKEIAGLMLEDSYGILKKESDRDGLDPIYELEDVEESLRLWQTVDYHTPINVKGGFTATFMDAGHILGSAMVFLERKGRKLVFTGDLGNSPSPLLHDSEPITGAHYVVMESVYGDRNHESRQVRRELLENVIEETIKRGEHL